MIVEVGGGPGDLTNAARAFHLALLLFGTDMRRSRRRFKTFRFLEDAALESLMSTDLRFASFLGFLVVFFA